MKFHRPRKTNLLYHPTWYIGKVIETNGTYHCETPYDSLEIYSRVQWGTWQMMVKNVASYELPNGDRVPHFVGSFIIENTVSSLMVRTPVLTNTYWLAQNRHKKPVENATV